MQRMKLALLLALLAGPASAQTLAAVTTPTNGVLTTAGVAQVVLPAYAARRGCLVTNTSTAVERVSTDGVDAHALPLASGAAMSCASPNGVTLADPIYLSGPAGSTYVVWAQ